MLTANVEDDFALIESCLSLSSPASLKRKSEDGETLLFMVISRAKHQNIWKTLLKIVECYTVEELQEKIIHDSTYLCFAAMTDSVVAARVLLEKGVDVNQRDFNMHGSTPLHSCHQSTDMYSLLVEFGADVNIRLQVLGSTPLQSQISNRSGMNVDFLELALTNKREESNREKLLHETLSMILSGESAKVQDLRETFRLLLCHDATARYINCVDEVGYTLLHRAVYGLGIDLVNLLLEAEADASIALTSGAISILPLQLACNLGRVLWTTLAIERRSEGQDLQARAFKVASELLQWHHAKADSLFEGITLLHLASHMYFFEEAQRLISAGYSREAKGRWPSIDHDVTPQELLDAAFNDEASVIGHSKAELDQGCLDPGFYDQGCLDPDFYDLLRLHYDFSDSDTDSDSPDILDWDHNYSTSRDFVLKQIVNLPPWNLYNLSDDFYDAMGLDSAMIVEVHQRLRSLLQAGD